jgi:DnaJ-class molecular chaperone
MKFCRRCKGRGQIIYAMSACGPHLYGPCPECWGFNPAEERKVFATALKSIGLVIIERGGLYVKNKSKIP